MTRKDFEMIAAVLSANDASAAMVHAMADALATTNSRFDRARFITAASPANLIPWPVP
jgi:hypothetical protein